LTDRYWITWKELVGGSVFRSYVKTVKPATQARWIHNRGLQKKVKKRNLGGKPSNAPLGRKGAKKKKGARKLQAGCGKIERQT